MSFIVLAILTAACLISSCSGETVLTWPSPLYDSLEHLLVDTGGANDAGFKAAITPCTNYVSGSQLLGRETAAQWIRVAFHDFATADVEKGTGGIDASIGFETLRPENSGSAMNDSLAFFAPFVNAHTSMSDLIALSVVMAVGACSGPHIPLRGGRIDATEGGELGVPEPESSIEDTLSRLQLAGFDQSDSIALTACGHTMGSVHNGGFPQVVPPSAITPNNTGGGVHFDATPAAFDINVVNEYLTWTGQRGGPLVTTDNVTVRSDLRLYTSDNNVTMQTLSQSSEYFRNACTDVFERMINTVPAQVNLSEVISPLPIKPVNVTVEVMWNGTMSISGFIRLLIIDSSKPPYAIKISFTSRNTSGTSINSIEATYSAPQNIGSSIFGTTYYYSFKTYFDSSTGISTFSTSTNSVTAQYAVDDTVLWLPHFSSLGAEVDSDGKVAINITAAVLASWAADSVEAIFSIPTPQLGTLSPRIETSRLPLELIGTAGEYSVYSGLTQLDASTANRTTVDAVAKGKHGTVVDKFRKLADLL